MFRQNYGIYFENIMGYTIGNTWQYFEITPYSKFWDIIRKNYGIYLKKLWDVLGKIMGDNGKNYGIYYGIYLSKAMCFFCQKMRGILGKTMGCFMGYNRQHF